MFLKGNTPAAASVFLALILLASLGSTAATEVGGGKSVEEAASRFLKAFENLDMPTFISCFTNDATVFFPSPEPAQRFDGKVEIQRHFNQVFAAIRTSSSNLAPPFHHLAPENLTVQFIGKDAAIVTFHLRNAERVGRRTLIFKRAGRQWLIAHLHASNAPVLPQPTVN